MNEFTIHTLEDSDGPRKEALSRIQKLYGCVPNVIGALAESPSALNAYHQTSIAVDGMTFTAVQLHVIWFTINRLHNCHYCMAAHMPQAITDKVPDDVLDTARQGGSYTDPELEALRIFTELMVENRGWVEPGQTPQFEEYTVVLKGTLRVESAEGIQDVEAGQAIITRPGEWVRYSTPGADGAEYIAVCRPAFSMDTVHRDAE